MSRSGYTDDCENLELYRANVRRSIRGKRGQSFLKRLAEALDAMSDKRLGANSFQQGECPCTLGALAAHRNIDTSRLDNLAEDGDDYYLRQEGSPLFDIAPSLVAEVMYENDEAGFSYVTLDGKTRWANVETPEQRWQRMRTWVRENLKDAE